MAGGVAAGIGGKRDWRAERWADYDDGLSVDGDFAASFGDFLLAGRRGFGAEMDAMDRLAGAC